MSKLIPQSLLSEIPDLYETQNTLDPICHVKVFTPDANWTWYLMEYDDETQTAFGYVCGFENELGYFNLDELERVRGPLGLAVERDVSFTPTRLSELKKMHNAD